MLISKLLIDIDWDDLDLIVKMLPLAAQIMIEWRRKSCIWTGTKCEQMQGKDDDEVHFTMDSTAYPYLCPQILP